MVFIVEAFKVETCKVELMICVFAVSVDPFAVENVKLALVSVWDCESNT
jgi:hypothetical protein